jgi:hypothetical protein
MAAQNLVSEQQLVNALPELANVLDRPDPRTPLQQKVKNIETAAIREMVRVNHHWRELLAASANRTNRSGGRNESVAEKDTAQKNEGTPRVQQRTVVGLAPFLRKDNGVGLLGIRLKIYPRGLETRLPCMRSLATFTPRRESP